MIDFNTHEPRAIALPHLPYVHMRRRYADIFRRRYLFKEARNKSGKALE